ncbi:hypothetical protein HO133_005604 [Letharia lupina]|uniref:Fumarylacetoacetate hydrolase n=1 Tax=Letharia lupina TaxID=560253 RepID=A0A8H6C8R4_9LECA|nr:uncharacterized protein HO133_005604 [Letharia lupina]KAF6219060.1 hypothetical protein HO133_005604 [Letharia lupina]
MAPGILVNGGTDTSNGLSSHRSSGRKLNPQDDLRFDPKLKPKTYLMEGTRPDSKVLFLEVNILDSTGADPYHGDVYIEGERIVFVGTVPRVEELRKDSKVRVINGRGRTLMSGLGDAHTHFTWNNGALDKLGDVGVEEHTLMTARSAQCYLDSGYTMCFGAASAKDRLDCVIRDFINAGDIPGPRYLANGKEMAVRNGELAAGITTFADGPLEMREVIRHHKDIGVDQVKLSMSGEEITESRSAHDSYYSDAETAACVDEAHRLGLRLCSHARARDSIKQCVKHGVDVIYHASYIDDEGMEMLEKNKHKHVVAPGINWLWATVYEAAPFGYSFEKAEQVGYMKELQTAIRGLKEMHERGITVLPGGDYGFAWTPHGTYARDLEHFVKLLDFTAMESIIAATAGVAKLFMREDELGKVKPGYFADVILVDGDPLKDIAVLQEHDKLNVIMINGRIHKASHKEFVKTGLGPEIMPPTIAPMTNFVAYEDSQGRARIGHLNLDECRINPMAMASGAPVSNLYQVIELGNDVVPAGEAVALDSVKLLPPVSGRDILCVGKNYAAHALEFNKSGYDASDKVDKPSHPVIFTKRSTSIVPSEHDIYPHPDFTQTLDYEGEIGVIIGKPGFAIDEKNAMDHVWGYTIINDVTAREKQRDHKQFYLGKSADTFCPMGPIAVPAAQLPKILRVQTYVNGEKRQDGTTEDLIFSVAQLVKTLSEGITLQPGDVLATGTPAGVGFGQDPPTFLKAGDTVDVTVTGLGKLTNRIADASISNKTIDTIAQVSSIPMYNLDVSCGGGGLTKINDKLINVVEIGTGTDPVIYVHGLGGTMEFYRPLIDAAHLKESHKNILYDLEGHGLTPTKASSPVTMDSLVDDLAGIFASPELNIKSATLISHSMGGLIAMNFALKHPSLVKKLILVGPGPSPLPAAASEATYKRAAAVRDKGMKASGVAETVANAATSAKTKDSKPLALGAVRASLLSQDPEGYAKGCMALAGTAGTALDIEKIAVPTLIVAGDEDKISSLEWARKMENRMPNAKVEVLKEVGHWHCFEDLDGVANAVKNFL